MRYLVLFGVLIGTSFANGPANTETPDENYVIFRLKTDLQRDLLFTKGIRNFVVVNGDAIVSADGSVRPKAINPNRLYLQLEEGGFSQEQFGILVHVLYKEFPPGTEKGQDILSYALIGAAHGPSSKGLFKEIFVASAQARLDEWKSVLAAAQESVKPEADLPEPGVRVDQATVYAVKTPLSRYKSGGYDCIIVVGDRREPTPEAKVIAGLEQSIATAIGKLKLSRTERVQFYYGNRPRDPAKLSSFNEANKELAKNLGFKVHEVISR